MLVETRDAKGGFTRYAYDGAGNPIVLQDPAGHSITASFNALGHKVGVSDPNMGEKQFSYNALGELLQDKDVNCVTTTGCDTITMEYDVLGRLIERRSNGSLDGSWVYDNAATDKGIGLLDYEDSHTGSGGHGLRKSYFYSPASSGRKALTRTIHRIYQNTLGNGSDYETRYYTDSYYGRPKGIRYPGGVGVAYLYNAGGYLVQEKDASSSYVLRQVSARDSRNQVIQSTLANGALGHTAEYFEATGQMKSITVSGSAGTVHDLDYEYDIYGNLEYQSTSYPGATASESFYYDELHRLMQSSRSYPGGSATVNYDYDASGNLTLKDDYASSYAYAGSRPNAVSSVAKVVGGTVNFSYDANGNLLTGDGKSVSYNAQNLPITITAGGVTAGFAYGADLARFRQDKSSGEVTLYIDKLMEVVQVGSTFDYRHYLGDVAILTKTGDLNDPAPELRFLLRDRLGSVVTVTDAEGQVDEIRGYDPFGKPREGDWENKTPPVVGSAITNRGFTDHEHLDESQLIHMNGRGYDYNLGRFLSVDPIIQSPGNSQSMNPYSYIMNNPLSGTDPSGYCSAKDTLQDCADSIEAGKTQDITNDDGNVIGFAGKDQQGNFYVTNNGGYRGHSAVQSAKDSSNGSGKGTTDIEATMAVQEEMYESKGSLGKGLERGLNAFQGFRTDAQVTQSLNDRYEDLLGYCENSATGCDFDGLDLATVGLYQQYMIAVGSTGVNTAVSSASSQGTSIALTRAATTKFGVGVRSGEFSIVDWKGYPAGVPKPQGPFRLIEGAEYESARKAANRANSQIRQNNNLRGQPVDVHEVHPVRFGGSPTNSSNKVIIDRTLHRREVTPWWNQLQRDVVD